MHLPFKKHFTIQIISLQPSFGFNSAETPKRTARLIFLQYYFSKINFRMWKLIIIVLAWQSCLTQYSVGVSNPFLLTTSMINIVTVEPDLQDQYLVSFIDGQARRYSADLASYIALSVPQTVQKFIPVVFQIIGIHLPNGYIFTMLSNMTVTLSNNFKTLRAYTYPSFTQFQSFNFSQPILDYQGFPLFISSLEPAHVLVFNQTTKVIHKGITTIAFDTNQSLGSYNVAVVFKKYVMIQGADYLNLTYAYVHKLGVLGLVQVNITLYFKYNSTSNSYDLTISSNFLTTSPISMNVKTMLITNGIVLMQMQSTYMLRLYGQIVSYNDYFDPYILHNDILDFFYIFNTYYILFTKGLVKVTIDEVNSNILFTNLVNTLPVNFYQLTFGVNLDTLFVPGTPYLYKAKCPNQASYSNGTCVRYNCSVANCDLCPMTANTCQTCSNGFTITDSFTCISSPINTTSPTTNPTNSSSNTSTNSTANSTTTVKIHQSSRFYSIFPFLQNFQQLETMFSGALNTTKDLISVPSLRRVSPTFYFFGNFDDLYLYSFHDRLYGNIMTDLFGELSDIQDKKWSLLGYGTILQLLGISNSSFFAQIDYQNAYVSYRFKTPDRPEQGSEALLANCANFFLTAMPLTVAAFLVFRFVFHLLFQYPVSQLFRKFDLVGCLFAGLFDGNIQQFSFYCAAQWRNTFFFSLGDKFIKLSAIYFGFMVVLVSLGGLLISYGMYQKLNKYLVDNNKNSLRGVSFLLLQSGLRNFVLGVLHSVLRPLPYTAMIAVLLSTELFFVLLFVISFSLGIYKRSSFMWFYIIISLIRILLIASLTIDNGMINDDTLESLQCTLILLMVFTYCIGTGLIIVFCFIDAIKDIARIVSPKSSNKPSQSFVSHIKVIANTTTTNNKAIKQTVTQIQQDKQRKRPAVFTVKNTIFRVVEIEGGIKQYRKARANLFTHQ